MAEPPSDDTAVPRRARRYAAKFGGTLVVDRARLTVEIADISRVGACVRGHDLPPRGQEVVLIATALEVVATVVWSDGEACGINFHETIAPLRVVSENMDLPNLNTLTRAIAMRP